MVSPSIVVIAADVTGSVGEAGKEGEVDATVDSGIGAAEDASIGWKGYIINAWRSLFYSIRLRL